MGKEDWGRRNFISAKIKKKCLSLGVCHHPCVFTVKQNFKDSDKIAGWYHTEKSVFYPLCKKFLGCSIPGSTLYQVRLRSDCAYLHADAALDFELQSDHVHLVHRAKLVKLRNFFGHLINRHFDRIQFCAWLAYDLYSLLHIWEQVTRCTKATQRK